MDVDEDVNVDEDLLSCCCLPIIFEIFEKFRKYTGAYRNTSDLKNALERIP